MCKPIRGFKGWHMQSSCCCGCGFLPRHFISKKEEIEMLEEYKTALQKELEGLNERIKESKTR